MTVCEPIVSRVGPAWVGAFEVLPELPGHFVRRARLEHRLSEGRGGRVTLVTGMAGSGKSALVAGWVRRRARETTAYLALHDADNHPERFWRRLVSALRVVDPEMGDNVLAALPAGMDDIQLAEVLAAEAAVMKPTVLVLDGLQVLRNRSLAEAVQYLAAHLPSQTHLIVTTRGPTDGGFHRLRLNGAVNEIDDSDLRFTDDEARHLLCSLTGQPLPTETIARLVEHTEGWAAGLTVAGLSIGDGKETATSVATLTTNSWLVADYFQREALRGQPAETVRFLVETAVLETMTPELCEKVTGRADAGRLLESLAARGVFVLPVGKNGGTYRYHRLFAEFLSGRAAAHQPEAVRQAHRRAADWWHSHGDDGLALHHLIKAHAHDRALALVAATTVRHFEHIRPIQDGLHLSEIPVTYLESHPSRMYVMAAALLAQRRPAEAATWLHILSRAVGRGAEARFQTCAVEMLWALHDALVGDADGVLRHQKRVDEAFPLNEVHPGVGPSSRTADRIGFRQLHAAVADRYRLSVAWARLVRREVESAQTALDGYVSSGGLPDDLGYLSLGAALAFSKGRLREACTLSQRALAAAALRPEADTIDGVPARITLAAVLRERNQLEDAEACLTDGLRICQQRNARSESAEVTCELIRVMIAQRRYEKALELVLRLSYLHEENPLPERLHRKIQRTELLCRLAMRDIHGAELTIRSVPPCWRHPAMVARLELLAGRPDRSERTLRSVRESASPLQARIERLVLLARAELLLGRQDRAHGTLRRALELGRPERYIRVFVEDAAAVQSLLLAIADDHPDSYLADLVAIVDKTRPSTPGARTVPPGQPVEPLTHRERDVLSLLPRHLSQREIGAALYLSHNTIKSHTKALYRKLGAACRSEAIETAQYHGLL